MENSLEIVNLTKKYEGFELDSVNISLPKGTIMGFIGENGAGKTTTIKMILDLISKDGGYVNILGKERKINERDYKEHIGVVLDESHFPEMLNIKHINSIMKKVYKTWNEDSFWGYIKRFELPEKKAVKAFSKGMKMKLSIAVALSHDTKLLILDEATSGLDPVVRDELLDVFQDFIQDEQNSVFMSSHIISDLEKICDYITFIHKGKIVLSEPKDELLDKFGIVRCTGEELRTLPEGSIVGVRTNNYGAEALVYRNMVNSSMNIEKASIEDIMLYHIKESLKWQG